MSNFKERKEKNVKGRTCKKTTYQYLKLEEWRQKTIWCSLKKLG